MDGFGSDLDEALEGGADMAEQPPGEEEEQLDEALDAGAASLGEAQTLVMAANAMAAEANAMAAEVAAADELDKPREETRPKPPAEAAPPKEVAASTSAAEMEDEAGQAAGPRPAPAVLRMAAVPPAAPEAHVPAPPTDVPRPIPRPAPAVNASHEAEPELETETSPSAEREAAAHDAAMDRASAEQNLSAIVPAATLRCPWADGKLYTGIVDELKDKDGVRIAVIDWDDGTTDHNTLKLDADAAFTIITDSCLITRETKNLSNVFRGAHGALVDPPPSIMPAGVFAVTCDRMQLGERLQKRVRFDEVVLSTGVNRPGLPTFLDLVCRCQSTSVGNVTSVTSIFVCVGYISYMQIGKGVDRPAEGVCNEDIFIPNTCAVLGVPIAVFKQGQFGKTSVKMLDSGTRFMKDDDNELPLDTLPIYPSAGARLMFRRVQSMEHLNALVGPSLVVSLRQRLMTWAPMSVLARDEHVDAEALWNWGRHLADRVPLPPPSSWSTTLLVGLVTGKANRLELDREERKRSWTAECRDKSHTSFLDLVNNTMAFANKNPGLFNLTAMLPSSRPGLTLQKKLMDLKPALECTLHGRAQGQMLNARAAERAEARAAERTEEEPSQQGQGQRRSSRQAKAPGADAMDTAEADAGDGANKRGVPRNTSGATGASPPQKKTTAKGGRGGRGGKGRKEVVDDSDDEPLGSGTSDVASCSESSRSSSGPPRKTLLAQEQSDSNIADRDATIAKLTEQLSKLSQNLEEVRDASAAKDGRLSELQQNQSDADALRQEVDRLRPFEVASNQKDETIRALRDGLEELKREKTTWQAMLACNMQMEQAKLASMLGAFRGGGDSSTS